MRIGILAAAASIAVLSAATQASAAIFEMDLTGTVSNGFAQGEFGYPDFGNGTASDISGQDIFIAARFDSANEHPPQFDFAIHSVNPLLSLSMTINGVTRGLPQTAQNNYSTYVLKDSDPSIPDGPSGLFALISEVGHQEFDSNFILHRFEERLSIIATGVDIPFGQSFETLPNVAGFTGVFELDNQLGGQPDATLFFQGASGNFTLDGGAIRAVPEPSSWALMICGFGGVGAALRRKRAGAVGAA
jgi:hypothetical protein